MNVRSLLNIKMVERVPYPVSCRFIIGHGELVPGVPALQALCVCGYVCKNFFFILKIKLNVNTLLCS